MLGVTCDPGPFQWKFDLHWHVNYSRNPFVFHFKKFLEPFPAFQIGWNWKAFTRISREKRLKKNDRNLPL